MHRKKRIFIGSEVTPKERDKVRALAAHTRRTVSAVLRELIARAETASPDIQLEPPGEHDPARR
ncbi:MAG: hypothetical protein ACYC4R_09970 [Anaerolineae bacterium]